MLGVLFGDGGVVDGADEDGFVGGVGYALAFGVAGEWGGGSAGRGWGGRPDGVWRL